MKKISFFVFMFIIMIASVDALDTSYVDYISKNIVSDNYNKTQARYVQKELNLVMNCDLVTDGVYGSLTKSCVKRFQKKYGITQTGWVGNVTKRLLNELYGEDKLIVSANNLNVRDNPGTVGTNKIDKVTKGNILTVLDSVMVDSTLWYHIRYNDVYGYVTSKYVKATFVEVDIVSQTLRLYQNTKLILDTPITTGKKDGVHDTNRGYFTALFKDNDRYLQPSNSYVRYWIRFYDPRALGIHDADWRGTSVNYNYFGGNRYKKANYQAGSKYTGSHGCVNVPVPKMPIIYNTVRASWSNTDIATPIYVH